MQVDLDLLERWLIGWSASRALPMPVREVGGLSVEVGYPDQLRRFVFADAGDALRACAAAVEVPFIHVKAPVGPDEMRAALPAHWAMEDDRFLMHLPYAAPVAPELPASYAAQFDVEHGAQVICLVDADGELAATGRIIVHGRTAVYDRVETTPAHRRKGLAAAVMRTLDGLAAQAGADERLLVATEAGRPLYLGLGWEMLAPYSTAVSQAR